MVVVLLMAACVVAVDPNRISFFLLGAIGAALFFTKINIGILYLSSALIASVCVLPVGRLRNIGGGLLVGAMVAGPIVLMHHFLREWAWGFCLLGILAGVSVMLSVMRAKLDSPLRVSALRYITLGAVAAATLIVVAMKAEGLSFSNLLEGVIVGPLRLPEVFSIAFIVTKKMAIVAILLSACVARLYWVCARQKDSDWIDALKCLAGLVFIGLFAGRGASMSGSRSFTFALMYSFLPLALLQSKGARLVASDYFWRTFVTALAATQILQAFPVAGSQVNIGAAPFLLWAIVCVYDGADGLLNLLRSRRTWHVPIAAASIMGALVFGIVVLAMSRHGRLRATYPFPASSLSGTASLHLPPELEMQDETLARNVHANCDLLFTMPGMGSFNFWSGVPTPDGFNMTAWMRGIPLSRQQHTLQVIQSDPAACILVQPRFASGWGAPDGGFDTLPLARYILHDMPIVFTGWGYEIHVSPHRSVPWVEQSEM